VAVAFRQIELIGAVWGDNELEKFNGMSKEEQMVINTMLGKMVSLSVFSSFPNLGYMHYCFHLTQHYTLLSPQVRSSSRIDTVHLSNFLSREEALAATTLKMEELNPYSQQGYIRVQLRNMM
jgi:hypothetical protein